MSNLYRILIIIIRPIIKIFFPYEVYGMENISELNDEYVLCSNHLSNLDPIFLALSNPRQIFFMAKAELFKNVFLRVVLKQLGVFAVERGKGDKKAINHAERILSQGKILGIFIEGTRSKTGEFLHPKSGTVLLANQHKSTIVPVCITGYSRNNRIKIFKKTRVFYGNPIKCSDLNILEGSRKEYKLATELVMSRIRDLRK